MEVIESIYARRSIKHFDPNHQMTTDEEQALFEAVIQAPTSFNIQHWRFLVLRDPELRAKIRKEFGNDQSQMTDASLLVLFTADVLAWKKEPSRYWANAPQEVADLLVGWMGPFHEGTRMAATRRSPAVHWHGDANDDACRQRHGVRFVSNDWL